MQSTTRWGYIGRAGMLGLLITCVLWGTNAWAQIRLGAEASKEETPKTARPQADRPTEAKPSASPESNPKVESVESPGNAKTDAPLPDKESEPSETVSDNGPLEPIPQGTPELEAASFNGVTPGQTTTAELEAKWGRPKATKSINGLTVHHFSIGPFSRVEATLDPKADRVSSIVIRFDKPLPAKEIAFQLQLSDIRPVFISNEMGEILGQSFPERGVLFGFEKNYKTADTAMKVTEIVVEPLGADPFLLRAETNLDSHDELNLHDLEQAIELAPENARAHWLKARVLTALNRLPEAIESNTQAIRLEEKNPRFHITQGQILAQTQKPDQAIEEARTAIRLSGAYPHVQARALCLMGDLLSAGPKPDLARALDFHTKAINTAMPLAGKRHPAIRIAAKEVLIDAHLGAATDIAWGNWSQKEKAVAQWIERAESFAEELATKDGGTDEHRFRVATRTLAILVGLQGKADPTEMAEKTWQRGVKLIEASESEKEKNAFRIETGLALFNAVQIYQVRQEHKPALEYGQKTIELIEAARNPDHPNREQDYLVGRLYFRLGAVQALTGNDHQRAVTWYEKALTRLDDPLPQSTGKELGSHGERFVSMGVSYWETDQKDKAIELTQKGLGFIDKAVRTGQIKTESLVVPYENLAVMKREQGKQEEAKRFEQLAEESKQGATAATAEKDQTTTQR